MTKVENQKLGENLFESLIISLWFGGVLILYWLGWKYSLTAVVGTIAIGNMLGHFWKGKRPKIPALPRRLAMLFQHIGVGILCVFLSLMLFYFLTNSWNYFESRTVGCGLILGIVWIGVTLCLLSLNRNAPQELEAGGQTQL